MNHDVNCNYISKYWFKTHFIGSWIFSFKRF